LVTVTELVHAQPKVSVTKTVRVIGPAFAPAVQFRFGVVRLPATEPFATPQRYDAPLYGRTDAPWPVEPGHTSVSVTNMVQLGRL